MQEVAKTLEIGLLEMLENLRKNHIDIIPIIEEELSQIVPQIIETVIKNTYRVKVEGI
jgi:hypothetical protein